MRSQIQSTQIQFVVWRMTVRKSRVKTDKPINLINTDTTAVQFFSGHVTLTRYIIILIYCTSVVVDRKNNSFRPTNAAQSIYNIINTQRNNIII